MGGRVLRDNSVREWKILFRNAQWSYIKYQIENWAQGKGGRTQHDLRIHLDLTLALMTPLS